MNNHRIKLREVADIVNISYERVYIIHEELHMKKLSARWVPRLLTNVQKMNRMTISKQCLVMFQRNPTEFLRRFIIVDETWTTHQNQNNSQNNG